MSAIAKFNQKGYRAEGCNFAWDKETTIGDVIRFEEEELGNDLGIYASLMLILDEFPAQGNCMWVAGSFYTALRYTIDDWDEGIVHPERVETFNVSRWFVIAVDGDDGYFIVHPRVIAP